MLPMAVVVSVLLLPLLVLLSLLLPPLLPESWLQQTKTSTRLLLVRPVLYPLNLLFLLLPVHNSGAS